MEQKHALFFGSTCMVFAQHENALMQGPSLPLIHPSKYHQTPWLLYENSSKSLWSFRCLWLFIYRRLFLVLTESSCGTPPLGADGGATAAAPPHGTFSSSARGWGGGGRACHVTCRVKIQDGRQSWNQGRIGVFTQARRHQIFLTPASKNVTPIQNFDARVSN